MESFVTEKINKLLETMGLSLSEEVKNIFDEDIQTTIFHVQMNDAPMLIGKNGEGLKAFNYIIRKFLEVKFPDVSQDRHIMIDVNSYYAKKINELKTKAKIVAERAISFKRNIELEPMTAYERLVIHAFLQKMPHIKTFSQGEGEGRHIVISYQE